MSEVPTSAGEGVLVAIQDAALGLARPFDSEQATRFEAALEALAPNTRAAPTAARWRPGEDGPRWRACRRLSVSSRPRTTRW